MKDPDEVTKALNEQFTVTCKKCGHTGAKFYNNVRYYDYTGKVGDAGFECGSCGNTVVIDE
jgi:ribosomal protein S27E